MNFAQASRAARQGAAVLFAVAVVDLLFFLLVSLGDPAGEFFQYLNRHPSYLLLDAAAFILLGAGIWKHSRTLSVLAVVFLAFGLLVEILPPRQALPPKLAELITQPAALLLEVLIFLVVLRATLANFRYKRLLKAQGRDFGLLHRLGSAAGWLLALLLVIGLGIFFTQQYTPYMLRAAVLPGSQVHASHERTLRNSGILRPGEDIRFFYAHSRTSVLTGGSLLTDQRVIGYRRQGGGLDIRAAPVAQIRRVEELERRPGQGLVILAIHPESGMPFKLVLSTRQGGHKPFLKALEDRSEKPDRSQVAAGRPGARNGAG